MRSAINEERARRLPRRRRRGRRWWWGATDRSPRAEARSGTPPSALRDEARRRQPVARRAAEARRPPAAMNDRRRTSSGGATSLTQSATVRARLARAFRRRIGRGHQVVGDARGRRRRAGWGSFSTFAATGVAWWPGARRAHAGDRASTPLAPARLASATRRSRRSGDNAAPWARRPGAQRCGEDRRRGSPDWQSAGATSAPRRRCRRGPRADPADFDQVMQMQVGSWPSTVSVPRDEGLHSLVCVSRSPQRHGGGRR